MCTLLGELVRLKDPLFAAFLAYKNNPVVTNVDLPSQIHQQMAQDSYFMYTLLSSCLHMAAPMPYDIKQILEIAEKVH